MQFQILWSTELSSNDGELVILSAVLKVLVVLRKVGRTGCECSTIELFRGWWIALANIDVLSFKLF